LINKCGTWHSRPEAVTSIKRLFLASDYVQTNVDLATMEGANEAARCAVNGILKAESSSETPCKLWRLEHPAFIEKWRRMDLARFRQKHPNLAAEYFRVKPFEGLPETTVESDLDELESWLERQTPADVLPRA